jgi:L,D-peptidoglycan transpeptidase YkuD (ErfK/YbiS/YcfS/YnhG family)
VRAPLLAALTLAGLASAPAPPLARQLIVVTAARYGSSVARLTVYDQQGDRRTRVFGPWRARIGAGGFAPVGAKREGDGRTPSGTFAFRFMFGVRADPGVRFPYRRVGHDDVWDDDPGSPRYNRWVDARRQDPGRAPEPLDQPTAYAYAAVIAYNPARTPGRGSAIFLHVGGPAATAGCVAVPRRELLELLRWMDPREHPRIDMGVHT